MESNQALLNALTSGKAVLFLGSGALANSTLKSGEFSPLGSGLAQLVYSRFYPEENYSYESLAQVSSMVQSKFGNAELHEFLRSIFEGIKPSKGVKKLTEFEWLRIYTTNIDRALESAYQTSSKKAKELITVVGATDVWRQGLINGSYLV